MQIISLQRHIHRRYDIWVTRDRDLPCPRCQHETFRLAQSEQTAVCRHQACGFRVFLPDPLFGEALSKLYNDCHEALLAPGGSSAQQLLDEGHHPAVLAHAMLGVVPPGKDIADDFAPGIVRLQQEVALEEQSQKKRGRPKKDEPAAAERLEDLKEHAARLAELLKGKSNALLVFYQGVDGRITAIRIVEALGRSHWFTLGAGTGVFGPDLHSILPPTTQSDAPTLWCADFKDVLHIQSAGARAAQVAGRAPETGYTLALALARHFPDVDTARAVSRPLPVVCTGKAGFPDDSLTRLNVRTNLRTVSLPSLVTPLKSGGLAALQALLLEAELRPRPLEGVRDECDEARLDPSARQFEIDRRVSDIVERDLGERGRYYSDSRDAYIFLHETKALLRIEPDDQGLEALLHGCGLAKTDTTYNAVITRLQLHAKEHGDPSIVYTSSHWDQQRQCLYEFDFKNTIYRISADAIDAVDNGTDGKLFLAPPTATPYTPSPAAPEHSLLDHHLFESVNFIPSQLSVEGQKILTRVYFYGLSFPELLPTRPVLTAVGPAGSGKSKMLRSMGQARFGPKFQVSPLSKDSKDVDAALTNSSFVVLDNADNPVSWFEDRVATAATGGSIKIRKLYSTNTQVEYPITAFVGITSRTPHFRREDVADRLLLVRMGRRTGAFTPENLLIEELKRDRDALMGEVFRDLQKIVRQLKKDADYVHTQDYRMADFANFAIVVGRALNCADQVERALEHLDEQRTDFATENNPVIELLEFWLEGGTATDKPLTAGQLFTELEKCAKRESLPFNIGGSSALGYELNKHWTTLEKLFGAKQEKHGGRRVFYTFRLPAPASEATTSVRDPGPAAARDRHLPISDDPDIGPQLRTSARGPSHPDDLLADFYAEEDVCQ